MNPPLRRGSSIHDPVFAALRDLGAENVRYVPWLPYPRLAVAELEPPTATTTSWDFSLIDPMTLDFLDATKGHSTILNFSTIPAWLFKTPQADRLTRPTRTSLLELHPGHGTERPDAEGTWRLLRATGQLVWSGRFHRRAGSAPQLRTTILTSRGGKS